MLGINAEEESMSALYHDVKEEYNRLNGLVESYHQKIISFPKGLKESLRQAMRFPRAAE